MYFEKTAEEIMMNFFNTMNKIASAGEEFKKALTETKTKSEVDELYNKYKYLLKKEISQDDWEMLCNSRKSQLQSADDASFSLKSATIRKSLNKLCSVADDFDSNGCEKFAEYIDEVIKKISKEIE